METLHQYVVTEKCISHWSGCNTVMVEWRVTRRTQFDNLANKGDAPPPKKLKGLMIEIRWDANG